MLEEKVILLSIIIKVKIGTEFKFPYDDKTDFGVSCYEVYQYLDVLGRKCLDELIEQYNLDRANIEELLGNFSLKNYTYVLDPKPPQEYKIKRVGEYGSILIKKLVLIM